MKNSLQTQRAERIYAFDWLRVIACCVVILIHTIHMFGELYRTQGSISFNLADGPAYGVTFLTQWCMALFFLLAGASTWLTLRRKTSWQFIKDRFSRLLLPLGIGFVLLVPLQAYFELVSNNEYTGSLISFYPYLLGGILFEGKLGWIVSNIHHLWFLAYLFGYSLLTLPLCLFLRSETGQVLLTRVASICTKPGGFLLPVLPIALIQVTLRALFPAYCSLADALCWLLFYIYGYILFASPQIKQALYQQGNLACKLSIAGGVCLLLIGNLGPFHQWMHTPDYSIGCLVFQTLFSLTLWSSIIATLTVSNKYLNHSTPMLTYSSPASFSWYLLHFPIMIIIASIVLPLQLPFLITFFIIGMGTFMITLVFGDLLFHKTQATRAAWKTGHQSWYQLEKALKTTILPIRATSRTITSSLDSF